MDREGFLRELAHLLEDIPENERREALDYYNSYFDDAGPENEAKIIQELGGTPEKAAASIRAEFRSGKTDNRQDHGEYTERGYRDTRIPHTEQMPRPVFTQKKKKTDPKRFYNDNNKIIKIILIVLILLVGGSTFLGLLSGLVGLIFGLLGGLLGIIFGIAAAVFSLLVGGIALTAAGVAKCLINPALGLLMCGFGLLLLSIGILLLILCVWLASKLLPWATQWSYDCLHRFCHWCKAKWDKIRQNK